MFINKKVKAILYFLLFIILFAVDRFSKLWALAFLKPEVLVLNGNLNFKLIFNRGISWGFLNNISSVAFLALSIFIFLIILGFSYYTFLKFKSGNEIFFEIFILVGALSNFWDRIIYGGVIDFIDIHIKGWHWPTFNIADVFIVIGFLVFLGRSFKDGIKKN